MGDDPERLLRSWGETFLRLLGVKGERFVPWGECVEIARRAAALEGLVVTRVGNVSIANGVLRISGWHLESARTGATLN